MRRQFAAIKRSVPAFHGFIDGLLTDRMRLVRIPLAILLIIGSFLAFLPIFGVWMLPLGLLLLALDIPALQPAISGAMIRLRRRVNLWWRRLRDY